MKKLTIITLLVFLSNVSFGNVVTATPKKDTTFLPIDSINNHWLYYEIKSQGVLYPDIVFGQAILESGHFKSKIFKENNNLFGMRLPLKRETTAIGKNRGYAVYSNWISSVRDYKLWQEKLPKKVKISKTAYYNYIQRIYCECSNYAPQVKNIIKRYQKYFN